MTEPTTPPTAPDRSHGWEALASEFIRHSRTSTIGVAVVEAWAASLPRGSRILDLACGPGSPRTRVVAEGGFALDAIDAAPSLAAAYRRSFPMARVACESIEDSAFFGERYTGILAWGVMFLLPAEVQRSVIGRVAKALAPGGSFLFTAPLPECRWEDLFTGRESVSLGGDAYRALLTAAGLVVCAEYEDDGDNHYYEARKP